jgi:hypothetical protein
MNTHLRTPLTLAFSSVFFLLNSCRKSDASLSPADKAATSVISNPVVLDLLPAQNQSAGDRRLFLPIVQVGATNKSNLRVIFDSGSEGMVFSATSLFASNLISDTGMVINNKDSAVINGVTITSAKVSSTYGDPPATRTFYGNIAYTTMVLGDQSGSIITERMPFMLVYKGVNNQTGAAVAVDSSSDGIAGVISSGFAPGEASILVTSRENIKSPLNYLNYSGNLYAGWMLSPLSTIGWTNVASNATTPASPLLTVGLTAGMEAGFALQTQRLDIGNLYDPDVVGTISYTGQTIPNSSVVFDTGTPVGFSIYNSSEGTTLPLPAGEPVQLSTAQGFDYSYTTDAVLFQTVVQSTGQTRSIFGLDFFLNTYYLLDYTNHFIGLKNQ